MQIRGLTVAAVLAAFGTLLAGLPAWAQDATEELEVEEYEDSSGRDPYAAPTGMEERVVMAGESDSAGDFAAGDSIAGFDASDLEALGALSVADLGKFTPNLEIVTAGATSPTFFIRGVGLNDFNSNAAGSVAVYRDDVALNAPALQLSTLFDMEGVNVLRGPVGTGPFRNASAGAIKLYSRKPTGDYNGYLRSSFGRFNSMDFEGAAEAPIFEDVLSGRVAFRVSQRDGYVTNRCGGAPPIPERGKWASGTTNGTLDDPRWSLCGETVRQENGISDPVFGQDGYSPIPAGLPTEINDLGNWAARATFRFQPTLDMDFLFNGHIQKRDQYSTQGISYGTRGPQVYPDGTDIFGRLGGQDGFPGSSSYRKPEVVDMEWRLRSIYEAPLLAACPPSDNSCLQAARRDARQAAEIDVANEIAQNLDSDPYTGDYNRVGKTLNDTWGTYLTGDIALPKDLTLRTVSAYDAYDRLIDADTDQSPNPLFEIKTTDSGWQFFQDLGLQGALADETGVTWSVGAFYLMESLDVQVDNEFGEGGQFLIANREYIQDQWSWAAYASMAWKFLDDFTLDGGIRYNWERKEIDYLLRRGTIPRPYQDAQVRSAPTGEARLTYNFREDTHAYFKYTRGWKGGHYNATASEAKKVTYAEPEKNNAFETGLRGSWFDSKVGFDASFFYYDYSDYQLFTVEQDFGSLPEFVVINASDVEILGAEVDLSARPWNGSFMNVRFGWLESKFTDFVQSQIIQETPPDSNGPITRRVDLNYSGNRLLNSPQFKLSLTGEQTVPMGRFGNVTARYDAAWSDTTYFDATEGRGLPNQDSELFLPEDTIGMRPYWIHNALLIYRPPVGDFELQAYVRNFMGEVYKTFAFDASSFSRTTIYFVGEPRTWGMTLLVNF